MDYEEARDAKEDMDRREFQGRVIDVVFAQQKREPSPTKYQRFLFVFFACTLRCVQNWNFEIEQEKKNLYLTLYMNDMCMNIRCGIRVDVQN